MFVGKKIRIEQLDSGVVELVFDAQDAAVNTLNSATLDELKVAVDMIATASNISGLLITSGKPSFILGADITEFQGVFSKSKADLKAWVMKTHELFCAIENLPFPSVAAINGLALGGGFEMVLAADFRVLDTNARVGLPEVNLGLCPGWGGTVRLSRLAGAEPALSWMLSGKPQNATTALNVGSVDLVVEGIDLREEALQLLGKAIAGKVGYTENSQRKHQARDDSFSKRTELLDVTEALATKLPANQPAPQKILELVAAHACLPFAQALEMEVDCFASLAQSDEAHSLIGLFLNDQLLKKKAKAWLKQAAPVEQAAVLGAGIMGGGVAYQSASTGTPIVMKDINEDALSLGNHTANRLLDKQVEKGRLDAEGKVRVLQSIIATLDYNDFDRVDLVVEAVVENPKVKASVLAEVERVASVDAVLASNTSTISIDRLADSLQRPEQFCGMHFFNPVHQMPLVEVIRGKKTSDQTIARTVAYAASMGKTPIVVNDCPGFLVNRILFPYFNGFNRLLLDGVDFQRIDRVMEQFGWPMGPAYLADVVGLDTMVHADEVLQAGYPERMGHDGTVIMKGLLEDGALGQKNGRGFYTYGVDDLGRRYKEPSPLVQQLVTEHGSAGVDISDEEIVERMMIPMCLEAVRCLEEGIVETAAEVDMGLILGLGFPRFRGGALRHIQTVGLSGFCEMADRHSQHGGLYQVTDGLRERALNSQQFYS